MRLLKLYPAIAALSCDECEKVMHTDGVLTMTGRRPLQTVVPRAKGIKTPCSTCKKIPHDAPERKRRYATEMTEQNWRAYQHYLGCAAVNWNVPEAGDPIVQKNAAIIKGVLDSLHEAREERLTQLLEGLFQVVAVSRGR